MNRVLGMPRDDWETSDGTMFDTETACKFFDPAHGPSKSYLICNPRLLNGWLWKNFVEVPVPWDTYRINLGAYCRDVLVKEVSSLFLDAVRETLSTRERMRSSETCE
jgi:hypothetical protein